jgi:hypothetical protein
MIFSREEKFRSGEYIQIEVRRCMSSKPLAGVELLYGVSDAVL